MIDNETRAVLATAKGIISAGWCQHRLGDAGGPRCLMGALLEAEGSESYMRNQPTRRAYEKLTAALPDGYGDVVTFNNAPERTQAEVVALFDKVLANNPAPAPTLEPVA